MTHYVYELYDPLTPTLPFYVGKGTGRRLYLHEYYAKRGEHYNKHLANKILKILNEGREIGKRKIVENVSSEEALAAEIKLIAKYKNLNIQLCNLTDGGEGSVGYIHTEEEKLKMRGRVVSEESKKKMSESHMGLRGYWDGRYDKPPTMLGKRHTEETKQKISKAKTGSIGYWNGKKMPPMTEEQKKKISETLKRRFREIKD